MGLFDKIKTKVQEKVNEVHVCARCGKEFSGWLNGEKLADGQYFCSDCCPKYSKLMMEKGVCQTFSIQKLDLQGVDKYHKYREKEAARISEFAVTKAYLGGKFLVDEEHGYFKLKEYDEVFLLKQITQLVVQATYEDGKIDIACAFVLNNWIYQSVYVIFRLKCKSLMRKNQFREYYDLIEDFHEEVCPNAIMSLAKF